MMKILINNREHEVVQSANILDVCTKLGIDSLQGLAIAVNEVVIAKSAWGNMILNEGDNVLLINAARGG